MGITYQRFYCRFIVDRIVRILRDNKICDRFDYVFEEKEDRHLHVWIFPKYEWMDEICDDIIENVGLIFSYAKKNYRNIETYKEIERITNIIKDNF